MKPGIFLKSTSLLDDTVFENSIIFIAEVNDKGAMGYIINKKYHRGLNELEEFKHIRSFPLYVGGPVDQEHLFFIHKRPDLIKGGTLIADGVLLGGNFKEAVTHINNNLLTGKDVTIFLGYCGWDHGELEAEIAEGSWEIIQKETPFQVS
jgi:putative transcriptional regulator